AGPNPEGAPVGAARLARGAPRRERAQGGDVVDLEHLGPGAERGNDGGQRIADLESGEPVLAQVDGDPLIREIDDGDDRQARGDELSRLDDLDRDLTVDGGA